MADLVPLGTVVADIGTDHAYLPIHLIQTRRAPWCIATDASPGSLAKARQAVVAAGLEDRIDLRLGSGLTVLAPGEVQVLVIAGLGSKTIADIIALAPEVAASAQVFLLQPMTNPGELRRRLPELGLTLTDETLAVERGRFYVIMAATSGTMPTFAEELLEIGPYLVAKPDLLLPAYLAFKIGQEEQVRAEVEKSVSGKARWELASRRIHAWREILHDCESKLRDQPNRRTGSEQSSRGLG